MERPFFARASRRKHRSSLFAPRKCLLRGLGSYQLTFTESNFSFTSSFEGFQAADHCTATEFPPYPSFPLDNHDRSLITPDTLSDKEKELLDSLRVNAIDSNKLEEKTRDQAECDEWMRERKLRFTASNFGKISRRH